MTQKIAGNRLSKIFRRFWGEEEGGILILSLMILVVMTVGGGLAVDLANHERTRTYLQAHLDNAVLAAASLSQDIDPTNVVLSYVSSAGLDASKVKVEISKEEIGGILVGRTVHATMSGGVNTYFFRFLDVDNLAMMIESQATERVEDIEISLVLDVSGSMDWDTSDGSGKKIDALKQAASDFVDAVLSEAEEGRVSISIIPYSTKANAGPDLLKHYNASQEHDFSHCIDFDGSHYTDLAVHPSTLLPRTGHFQYGNRYGKWSITDKEKGDWVCRFDDGFTITPLSSSAADLKAQINKLTAKGSTSIDMGTKWGLALLDPSAQTAVSGLISDGLVSPAFEGRPHPHKSQNNMKVLVIMTDGKNDVEYRLYPKFASGPSPVTKSTYGSMLTYSVEAPETYGAHDQKKPYGETYFYPEHPIEGERVWKNHTPKNDPEYAQYASQIDEKQLTWPEVWAEMSPIYYGYNLLGRQSNYRNSWGGIMWRQWENMHYTVKPNVKNARLRSICGAAKQAGIVTYTIGMEVEEPESLALLKECAATEAHYFDVKGMDIATAFDMIAASISMLRLTK
ncbi:VWA domain-containing protein [Sulfitobacter maritimus]|uniref:VWA domain-containing protein n=1 Tax=Sulfitobacter maritimus TaxID=2741719 RepID=UPI0015835D5D|nr:VWA domain-containing protein [Sulfitobacter maritimus]